MMRYEYDPQLVEQATFLAARRDPGKECVLHETLDPLYKIVDAELRQRTFREVHGELFRKFDLDQIVPAYVRTFRFVNERLGRCIIREAERSRAQSVDLYRQKSADSDGVGERVLIVALCPECLLDPDRLGPWLYRQLQHVEDMVDDGFAYESELPDVPAVQQNLIRDRYAVLWDMIVEGRLVRSGKLPGSAVDGLWKPFSKAFTRDGRGPSRITFGEIMGANDLTHTQLMTWAMDPGAMVEDEKGGREGRDANAGECAMA